jgi:predicted transcriptional regulator
MQLNQTHIKILDLLVKNPYKSISALAHDLNLSISRTHFSVQELNDLGLIDLVRNGKSVEVNLATTNHAMVYKKIKTKRPHINLEYIFTGQKINIITQLLRAPQNLNELAYNLNVSSRTILRNVARLRELGIIRFENRLYLVNSNQTDIFDFVKYFLSYINMRSTKDIGTVIWEHLDEFIIESSPDIEKTGFYLTGYRALTGYGLQLLTTSERHYFYSTYIKELRLEDICLHILALNLQFNRDIIFISIVILKNQDAWDWKYFTKQATIYKISSEVQNLKEFVQTRGENAPEGYPNWDEVSNKLSEYD